MIRYSNISSSRTGRRSRFVPRRFVHSQRTKGIQSHRANSRRRGLLWGEKLSDLRIITGHDFRNVRRNSRLQRSPRHSSEIDEGVKLMFLWRPCLILYCIVSCIFYLCKLVKIYLENNIFKVISIRLSTSFLVSDSQEFEAFPVVARYINISPTETPTFRQRDCGELGLFSITERVMLDWHLANISPLL